MKSVLTCLTALLLGLGTAAHATPATEAREHYRKGSAAYDVGAFADAAKEFEAAYAIKQDPSLLFNLGQAYRGAKERDKALVAYRSFLRKMPESKARPQVEASISELEGQIAEEKRQRDEEAAREQARRDAAARPVLTENVVVAERPAARTPVYKKWWLWTAVGGAVAIGLGVGLGVGLTRGHSGTLLPAVGGGQ